MAIKWSGLKMDVCCQRSCGDLSQLNVSPAIWSSCHRALLADEIYGCSWAAYLQLKNWPQNASAETRGENLHFHLLFGSGAVSSSWEKGKEKSKAKKEIVSKISIGSKSKGFKTDLSEAGTVTGLKHGNDPEMRAGEGHVLLQTRRWCWGGRDENDHRGEGSCLPLSGLLFLAIFPSPVRWSHCIGMEGSLPASLKTPFCLSVWFLVPDHWQCYCELPWEKEIKGRGFGHMVWIILYENSEKEMFPFLFTADFWIFLKISYHIFLSE